MPSVRTQPFRAALRRESLDTCRMLVDGALHDFVEEQQVDPLALRAVLASAFRAAVLSHWPSESPNGDDVLLGLRGGRRLRVPIRGMTLAVPLTEVPSLSAHALTLLHRTPAGMVRVVHDVELGAPDLLMAAAVAMGQPEDLGLLAIQRVLHALGEHMAPGAHLAAMHLPDESGWELFRFVEVSPRVVDSRVQIGLEHARELEPDSDPGDLLGMSLPVQDWLTPVLCWMAGAG